MHILIVNNSRIPVKGYGGTQRIIWWLGKGLVGRGHRVTYLVAKGSKCPFAPVLEYNRRVDLNHQIQDNIDIVHFHFHPAEIINKPYLITIHGNPGSKIKLDKNCVFLSQDHAHRYHAKKFVYNGIDFADYCQVDFNVERLHLLFLARTRRKVKNLAACKEISRQSGEKLVIAGGRGFSFNPRLKYVGYINGSKKNKILNRTKALLYPVRGYEPFGLALIESLYFGCPVIGTPYGSLPEIIPSDVGYLADNMDDLVEAIHHIDKYNRRYCHDYAVNRFSSEAMVNGYLRLYETILNGHALQSEHPMRTSLPRHSLLPFGESSQTKRGLNG